MLQKWNGSPPSFVLEFKGAGEEDIVIRFLPHERNEKWSSGSRTHGTAQ